MPIGKIIKTAKYLMKKGKGKKPESPMSDADLIQAIRESPDAYILADSLKSRPARAEALRKLSDVSRKLSDVRRNPARAEALRKIGTKTEKAPPRVEWESRKLSSRQLNTALFGESTPAEIAFMDKAMRKARHTPQDPTRQTKGKGYKAK